jgi:hypothetical protein
MWSTTAKLCWLVEVVGSWISRGGISNSGFRWISNDGISKLENGRFMGNPWKSHTVEVNQIQKDFEYE